MGVKITFHTIEVEGALDNAGKIFLEEAGGVMESAAKRNARRDTTQTATSYSHYVEGNVCHIGSPLQNAIWEEFGTGKYAETEHGGSGGRQGGWWIKVGSGKDEISEAKANKYKWAKVRKKKGKITAVFTYGKRANRTLFTAYTQKATAIERRAKQIFAERFSK